MLHIKLKEIAKWSSMVENILPTYPYPHPRPLNPGDGVENIFFWTWSCCIILQSWMQQHGSKYFTCRTLYPFQTPTLGIGPIGQNSGILKHGNAAYQFKGIYEMQQHGRKIFCPQTLNPSPISEYGFTTWSWFISNYRQSRMQQHDSK